eukprot:99194-Pyramimonas_sp.AAC.1
MYNVADLRRACSSPIMTNYYYLGRGGSLGSDGAHFELLPFQLHDPVRRRGPAKFRRGAEHAAAVHPSEDRLRELHTVGWDDGSHARQDGHQARLPRGTADTFRNELSKASCEMDAYSGIWTKFWALFKGFIVRTLESGPNSGRFLKGLLFVRWILDQILDALYRVYCSFNHIGH